ncbi:MAG: PilZ domain-containing protein [Desulfobacteraceae bacterium]|nr:PilZ domain-containing protein [Desulfobacteraceae bacterium]MBC2752707.1 PilZ domain-containing protein [Desulfobacteraceae bacterium]
MISEKRKHMRVNALNLSHVAVDDREEAVKQAIGRTLNVSETGILLETHFPIESDQNVELTLGFEEDLVNLKGKVIHLLNGETGKFEMGIQFTDIDEEAILVIKDFINRFRELKNK